MGDRQRIRTECVFRTSSCLPLRHVPWPPPTTWKRTPSSPRNRLRFQTTRILKMYSPASQRRLVSRSTSTVAAVARTTAQVSAVPPSGCLAAATALEGGALQMRLLLHERCGAQSCRGETQVQDPWRSSSCALPAQSHASPAQSPTSQAQQVEPPHESTSSSHSQAQACVPSPQASVLRPLPS